MRILLLSVAAALAGFGVGRICGTSLQQSNVPPGSEALTIATPSLPPSGMPDMPDKVIASGTAAPREAPPAESGNREPGADSTSTKRTLNERIAAVYEHGNPFASAVRIQALIATFTAEDFHWLTMEAKELPTKEINISNANLGRAVMDALVDRWLKVDPKGALSSIRQLQQRFDQPYAYGHPLYALARVRPEVLLDDLPEGATWGVHDLTVQTAFSSLGERDPAAARRYLERCRLPDQRKQAEEGIAMGVARRNPVAAVRLAADLDSPEVLSAALKSADRTGAGMIAQVLDAAGGKVKLRDPYMDGELMMRYPDLPWATVTEQSSTPHGIDSRTCEAAATLTPEERDRVLAHAEQLPAGFGESTVAAIVNTWASQEPQKAIEWALNYSVPEDSANSRNQPLSYAFSSFVRADSATAVAWWTRLPASPLKQTLGNRAATILVREGKLDQALTLFQPLPDQESSSLAAELVMAQGKSNQDPAKMAAWIEALPPEVKIWEPVEVLMREWLVKDPGKAAQWVETQPEGARRDQAVTAFAEEAAKHDPKIAEEWAATITNPLARQSVLETIYRELRRRNHVAARGWLRALAGVDEEWRDRLLRMQP